MYLTQYAPNVLACNYKIINKNIYIQFFYVKSLKSNM